MTALRGHQRAGKGAVLFVALLVLAGALGPVTPRAQLALIELAAREPSRTIQVIVQMTGERDTVYAQLERLGAKVTRDLHIINAVAAELQAGQAVELARSPGVKWISLDSPVYKTAGPDAAFDSGNVAGNYVSAIGADRLWAEGYQGSGVTVAVVDSGMANSIDLGSRILARVKLNSNTAAASDQYGHGSHIAGIVGSSGVGSEGQYVGVAPKVNLVSVKVTDDQGAGSTSDLVAGLQWVLDNKDVYSIKVVNISLNSSTAQSYNVDPLDAACEILWFNKIVVVVSAGNNGNGVLNPPANDPFVITVGSVDDRGTRSVGDDALAVYSAYGVTESGFGKPDVVAPGSNIVSTLASNGETLAKAHPANVVPGGYFRMSGTSMASGVTAGAAALLLQA
ncbi:MAG: S8 family serine peptidase, partial [Rudaea sp.]